MGGFGLRGLGLGATIGCVSGRSAVGSAPRSGRGGRWFKSSRPDHWDCAGDSDECGGTACAGGGFSVSFAAFGNHQFYAGA